MDPEIVARANLGVQIALFGLVAYAGYVAKFTRNLQRHCLLMRVAVILLIVMTVIVMAPAFFVYARAGIRPLFFYTMLYIHVAAGLGIIAVWIYAHLALARIIKMKRRLVVPMRVATSFWIASFITGVLMYIFLWT